jgi:hypothetical protein
MTPRTDPKPLRTAEEQRVGQELEAIFNASGDPVEVRLETFPKYVRRQHITRFLAHYEIFKRVLPIKGSVIECGVNRGFGVMAWAKLSAVLEPVNLTRRIYGFDTFAGFPSVHAKDVPGGDGQRPDRGALAANVYDELLTLIELYDRDRFLGHIPKVELVRGDALQTIPEFMARHPHLVVSLLFLDFDLYEPTRVALEAFLPRMPKGAILAFDELDNPLWPGETMALLETVGIRNLAIERLDFDPYIGFVVMS